jgi:hypothetical protein
MYAEAFQEAQRQEIADTFKGTEATPSDIQAIIINFSIRYRLNPIQEIERFFDENSYHGHLIAIPVLDHMRHNFVSRMPHTGSRKYPYFLYVSASVKERDELFTYMGINENDNFIRLKETGLLVERDTVGAREMGLFLS